MTRPDPQVRMCLLILPGLLGLIGNVGCSQVRLIRGTPDGGVISIPNNSNQWPTFYRNQAESLMQKKCPQGYVIVSERVEEDNPAAEDGRKPYEDFDYNGAYERITNYRRMAYHIAFRRKSESAPADPDAPGKAIPGGSPVPPTENAKEELPPPRPVSPNN